MLPIYIITLSTRNAAEYINDTITSVIKQGEWGPIIYHVQEGGSTDSTPEPSLPGKKFNTHQILPFPSVIVPFLVGL